MSSTVETLPDWSALEALLVDLERDPADLVQSIAAEREVATGEGSLARELDRSELRFLAGCSRDRRHDGAMRNAVSRATRAWFDDRSRSLRATISDHPAVLFDLAELRADYRHEGLDAEAGAVGRLLVERLAEIDSVSDALREESRERYAALATQAEDLEIRHNVLLLEDTHWLLAELAQRTGDRELEKLARRLGRQACDRALQMRIEGALTRRGAVWLENTSLILLVVLLALLFVETSFTMSQAALQRLFLIDACICLFFIVEFVFKLLLAPAKLSWFLRNAVTDLLPAIPAALWLVPAAPTTDDAVLLRVLRLLRITWFARYVQALRPILRLYLLLMFLLRSMDSLVRRFSHLLNRNFVFFERAVLPLRPEENRDRRSVLFQALRREHVLLADLPVEQATPLLIARAERLADRLQSARPVPLDADAVRIGVTVRDVPVEHAIEYLHRLQPAQLGQWLPRRDVLAIDRLVRVLNAPMIRWLPIVRAFRCSGRADSPEERVVDFGQRVAILLEAWRERILHVADMHGIVTGPQVLDRIATALVKASQRPAVRLLLFGALFWIVQMILGGDSWLGGVLERFVALPLVILGSVCLVVLAIGRWLKALAGEAADTFKLTSEANFIGLLELAKRRHQDADLEFLGRRVFRWDMDAWEAAGQVANSVRAMRTGREAEGITVPPGLEAEVHRVALLYLHFLDGSVLHENDVKTTEQLLANLSLENIRNAHLRFTRKDRRRLKKLSLLEGSLFRGPFVWFRFITESVAVETAKRVTDYNRNCLTLSQRQIATPRQRLELARWLRKRRRHGAGRYEKLAAPARAGQRGRSYRTTEFNALDFLSVDPQRERHVERVFGRPILHMVQRDRESMIREIFGTRPLHELPRSQRTLNLYAFYRSRLSAGRVLLVPWYLGLQFLRGVGMTVAKTRRIVKEILAPELAATTRERGRAPFAVALRKIHRMKGPTLLEAMRTRVAFDPSYCGAPPGWSMQRGFEPVSELDHDMDFLMMRERDRAPLRDVAARNRRRVEELHHLVQRDAKWIPREADPDQNRRGERALTIAYMTDRRKLRTLFRAERWFERALPRVESRDTRLPARRVRRLALWICRGFRPHLIDRWLATRMPDRRVSRRGRENFRRAWHDGDLELRRTVRAWLAAPAGAVLRDRAVALAQQIYRARDDISRELAALRAVQSLSVLDVRNYRKLVFDLGGYEREGEDRALAEALP